MSELKLKKDAEPICMTEDFWYMLTDGGYLKPEEYLEPESAKKVREAINTIKDFEKSLEDNDLLEEM